MPRKTRIYALGELRKKPEVNTHYNRNRRHNALGYISPAAFEAKQVA